MNEPCCLLGARPSYFIAIGAAWAAYAYLPASIAFPIALAALALLAADEWRERKETSND